MKSLNQLNRDTILRLLTVTVVGAAFVAACAGGTRSRPRTQVVAPLGPCQFSDLIASGNLSDGKHTSPDLVEGVFALTLTDGASPCLVSANASYALEGADGQPVDVSIDVTPPTDYSLVLEGTFSQRTAFATFTWKNWCRGPRKGPIVLTVRSSEAPAGFRVPLDKSARSDGSMIVPPCKDPGSRSVLTFPSGYWGEVIATGLSPCRAMDLEIEPDGYASLSAGDLNGELPGIEGSVRFNRHESPGCTLTNWDKLELRDSHNTDLDVQIKTPIDVSPRTRRPRVIYGPSNGYEKFVWTNWCGTSRPGPLHLVWTLPGNAGEVDWPVPGSVDADGNIIAPPCAHLVPNTVSGNAEPTPSRPSEFSIPRTF